MGGNASNHRQTGYLTAFREAIRPLPSGGRRFSLSNTATAKTYFGQECNQVALALERGQSFTAVIDRALPSYDEKLKRTGALLDIKVEYLLDKGQPAIEAPKYWRAVESSPESSRAVSSFFTTVAGVTFEGRQRVVARCSNGERLTLVRDPNNPHDSGAIRVMRLNGQELGFIPAHVSRGGDSSGLAVRMDRGDKYQCRISALTGGGTRTLGVNIEITEGKFDELAHVDGSTTPDARALLWLLAIAVIGCLLWVAFKFT